MTINNIVAIILGIVGLIWLLHGLWRNWKINRISTWPKANATVLNAVAKPANSNAGTMYMDPRNIVAATNSSAKYEPIVFYRYRVGNRDYQSENVIYSGANSYNALETKNIFGQIQTGGTIPVYYNPNNPSESYIYNGTKSYTGIVIGIILLLLAAYLGYYHNLSKHRKMTTTMTIETNKKPSNMVNSKLTDMTVPNLTDYDISVTNPKNGTIAITPIKKLYRGGCY